MKSHALSTVASRLRNTGASWAAAILKVVSGLIGNFDSVVRHRTCLRECVAEHRVHFPVGHRGAVATAWRVDRESLELHVVDVARTIWKDPLDLDPHQYQRP